VILRNLHVVEWYPMSIYRFIVTVTAVFVFGCTSAFSRTKSDLEDDGWQVVAQGTIDGSFNGCAYGKPIPLQGGGVFICEEYNYDYAYSPTIYEMRKDGARKYAIDNEVFDGHVESGSVTRTNVTDDFEGCEYDKYIPLDNGLVFQCRTYHYHYAYHPDVVIVSMAGSYMVTIDGEQYDGTLYRR
jgi:hypothetical protein